MSINVNSISVCCFLRSNMFLLGNTTVYLIYVCVQIMLWFYYQFGELFSILIWIVWDSFFLQGTRNIVEYEKVINTLKVEYQPYDVMVIRIVLLSNNTNLANQLSSLAWLGTSYWKRDGQYSILSAWLSRNMSINTTFLVLLHSF